MLYCVAVLVLSGTHGQIQSDAVHADAVHGVLQPPGFSRLPLRILLTLPLPLTPDRYRQGCQILCCINIVGKMNNSIAQKKQ